MGQNFLVKSLWFKLSLVKTELEQLRELISALHTFLVEKVAPVRKSFKNPGWISKGSPPEKKNNKESGFESLGKGLEEPEFSFPAVKRG